MNCPKCHNENSEGSKFCLECGESLDLKCPNCGKELPLSAKFCNSCGQKIDKPVEDVRKPVHIAESERKHVTVLFSDMSGYTAMTEKLDPEEVKEIMGKVFGEISKVVSRYEGFIEKFIGDAVMALFGVPKSHEDDPVRAIKAARDIHDIVEALSPKYEKRIGKPLSMHTGICTGLVITGEVDIEKGKHGVLGDTINTAARLTGLAKSGEIVIGHDTYCQAEGYFIFEPMEPTTVKGKAEPIKPYRVISPKDDPTKTHRLSGMRAELIGRKVEMSQLQEAVTHLKQGKGSIFSIVGDAGTGKSRLIEDFKATINLDEVQWREGHAYAYAQNTPYFPLIDLLSRAYQIQEGDSPEQVKQKVETGSRFLISEREDLIPYVGSLYSLKYPEIENVSPEYWKASLHEAIQLILANLCKRSPAVICIEDLHWADPSSVELLRNILSDFRYPAVFLCIYRPTFNLFTSQQAGKIKSFQEIRLHDLSPTDAQSMVESLLKTEAVPGELKKFMRDRAEGNPFYLEEVINSLLETELLVSENGQWELKKPLIQANIPSTVQGVISARLDRLERETKRILQEASVIGRAFLYEILKQITDLKEQIDRSLMGLEKLDLIRTRTLQPDLEYIFKHALTQEVVYNGLLKKERQNIHEKIGQVMEELFNDRLPEFYEALAYHFKQGHSTLKAIKYLKSAGQKSLFRYAVEESHQYYREAYEILIIMPVVSDHDKVLLIDLILDWAVVFHQRADYFGLLKVLEQNLHLAETIDSKVRLGMFYVWYGAVMERMEMLKESHGFLQKALQIGESEADEKIIAYAHCWLSAVYQAEGFFDDALSHAKHVQTSDIFMNDRILFLHTTASLGLTYWFRGDVRNTRDVGTRFLEYGRERSDMRSICTGYLYQGMSYTAAGDFPTAITFLENGLAVAPTPYIVANLEINLGMAYFANQQLEKAEELLKDVIRIDELYGYGFIGNAARAFFGIITIMKGQLSEGVRIVEDVMKKWSEINSRYRYAHANNVLGQVYLQMVLGGGEKKKGLSFFAKNIGFLIKTLPFADRKAEEYLGESIKVGREIGAKGVVAQASLGMGRLRRAKKRNDEAHKYITDAIQLFEECEADIYLKQAREALATLG